MQPVCVTLSPLRKVCVCDRKYEPQVSLFYVQLRPLPKQVLEEIELVEADSKHREAILAAGSVSSNHVFIFAR